MIEWIKYLNLFILLLFFCCYSYQFVYVGVRFLKKTPIRTAREMHKYAVLVAARNESQVIGELLKSIWGQNYPKELLDVFAVADNCTDETAKVTSKHGAVVFERHNMQEIGKGYALNYAFNQIQSLYGIDRYEGYLILDADNVEISKYINYFISPHVECVLRMLRKS